MPPSNVRARKPTPQLADFPHRAKDIVRFADLDPQGHVNNAVFSTYFETGRVAMFRNPDLGIGVANATFVLVRQEIDFMRELHWPSEVVIGSALVKVGRTSFTLLHAVFEGEACAAAGRATMVMLDAATRRPKPLTAAAIARLEPWRYRGPKMQ
jgi:acyl-CoA thioester hydrolase